MLLLLLLEMIRREKREERRKKREEKREKREERGERREKRGEKRVRRGKEGGENPDVVTTSTKLPSFKILTETESKVSSDKMI